MTTSQQEIERMYQRAMNLRDSTWQAIDFEPIEAEYTHQYQRAYRVTQDVTTFAEQTKEYRALLRAYKQASLNPAAAALVAERERVIPEVWQILADKIYAETQGTRTHLEAYAYRLRREISEARALAPPVAERKQP